MIRKANIIAFDPGHREVGYAHFDGDELVDYGVKSLRRVMPKYEPLEIFRAIMVRFIKEKSPSVIALEKNSFSKINQNLPVMKIIKIIRDSAARNHIPLYDFAPNTIRKEVCNDGRATKREVSKFLSIRFPELVVYRESNRIWRERYYQNMFDAVACGLTYLKLYGKESNKKE
jgi:Holliday junction resolvasome RuvABC endonuclease subunit